MELNINQELKELIPKLQQEEYQLLEKSITEEGCRDSLIVWDNTIIDGHNRYEICTRNNIPFKVQEMDFENIGQVKNWMIKNQLARRNLTDSQRRYFIGKRYEEEKREITNPYGVKGRDDTQNGNQLRTSEKIAKENNISKNTVIRNRDYSKAIDKIKEHQPEVAEKILNEEIKISNKDVITLSKHEPEEREKITEVIESGEASVDKAFQEIKKQEEKEKLEPEESQKPHVSNNSGNNEWYTPTKYLDIARKVMGSIDTDPATSELANKNVQATTIYTEESNGLEQEWKGNIWMNPPYAQPLIQQFSDKLIEEIDKGNVKQAMVLVNNATETRWFNTLSAKAKAIWFIRGRIKFIDMEGNPSGAPLQGQAIIYFGDNVEKFIRNCEGLVCRCNYE